MQQSRPLYGTKANQPWSDAIAAALVLGGGIKERGGWCGRWPVQGATEGQSGFLGLSFPAGSQAGLCWHVWDLQLSAGEICTAESAGGGRRAGQESGKHEWIKEKLENWPATFTGLIHLNTSQAALTLLCT